MTTAPRRATPRRATTACAVGAWLVLVAGCGSSDPAALTSGLTVPDTVEIGAFPQPLSGTTEPAAPSTTVVEASSTTTEAPADPITGPIGDEVFGNRLLLIGDTVLAATAPRFGGAMCDVLEAFGWQAEIDAEPGRFVEFGQTVLDQRLPPESDTDWDAAAIMLGNHFDGDVAGFRQTLDELIAQLAPRPTIVYTLVEDDTFQADLNDIIRDMPRFHPNVVVLDWADIVLSDSDVILADTPTGLSDEGLGRLALFTAATLGEPPTTDGAGCLPPFFVDDSAIVL